MRPPDDGTQTERECEIDMAIIPKPYKDAVVAFGIDSADGKRYWIGTGFMVGRKEGDRYTIYIITNKHVVKNFDFLLVRFNNSESIGVQDMRLPLHENGVKLYSEHPNENSDIIAVQIIPSVLVTNHLKMFFFDLEDHALSLDEMRKTDVDEGTLVYALGFSLGMMSDSIKAPICRVGCISRIADAFVDPHRADSFLVDAQAFPGNSGGPVLNRPEITSIEGTQHNEHCKLIGVLSASVTYQEPLYSKQTGEIRMIQQENSGLTVVHPVDRIKEVVELEWQRHQAMVKAKA